MEQVLPPEILDKVIDVFSQLASDQSILYGTLRACSIASRTLRPRSQYNIFKHTILETRAHLRLFLQIIGERPYFAPLVTELTLSPLRTEPHWPLATIMDSLDKTLPNLRSIAFHGVHLSPYPHRPMSQILRLSTPYALRISNTTFQNVWHLRRLVGRATTLESLELSSIDFVFAPTEADGERALQIGRPVLPSLRKLRITGVSVQENKLSLLVQSSINFALSLSDTHAFRPSCCPGKWCGHACCWFRGATRFSR